jgi:CYTH domain-containing protein
MPVEIERKYLVKGEGWKPVDVSGMKIRQGYMFNDGGIVRARVAGERGYLTLKGQGLITRHEYEYEIPAEDADEIIEYFCAGLVVEKVRYDVNYEGHLFSVDVFEGENEGLVLAEVELQSEEEGIALPDWIGEEVTHNPRYHNSNLLGLPYSQW